MHKCTNIKEQKYSVTMIKAIKGAFYKLKGNIHPVNRLYEAQMTFYTIWKESDKIQQKLTR